MSSAPRPEGDALAGEIEAVFGDRADAARAYADLLTTTGIEHGLLGPREAERVWDRHILNCATLARVMPADVSVIDVGSGAGLPGIPLALARPDVHVTLLEPLLRRVTWLEVALDALALPNLAVERGRAEETRTTADHATARAVAPLAKLAGWCLPLVGPGGSLWALKGESAQDELDEAAPALARLGVVSSQVHALPGDTYAVQLRVGDRPAGRAKGAKKKSRR